MKADGHLRTSDVRELLRILGSVMELRGDAVGWRRRALEGICDLTGANCGMAAIGTAMEPGDLPKIGQIVEHRFPPGAARNAFLRSTFDGIQMDPFRGAMALRWRAEPCEVATYRREDLVPDRVWYSHPHVTGMRLPAGVDHMMASASLAAGANGMMLLVLYRFRENRRRFSVRERTLLDLFHHGLGPYYRQEDQALDRERNLSPRLRQTLGYLLAGKNGKDIAAEMDLSTHTVSDYIKAIYEEYGVTSRGELLARFIV